MRRVAWSLLPLALLLAASGAKADDLYRTNPGPNGADFSGVELGPDLGVALGSASSANISGPAGGAHVGYNFQSSRVVGGVEADAMFSSIRSGTLGSASFSQDFLSSARVKGGYAFGNLLAYGTVGWAWSTTNYQGPRRLQRRDRQGARLWRWAPNTRSPATFRCAPNCCATTSAVRPTQRRSRRKR